MTYFVRQQISRALESWNLQQSSHHFLTSKTIIWLFHCLLSRGYFQHIKSVGTVFPQFKQNLMQTHCSFKSATFHVYQNCKWNNMYVKSHHSTTTHVTSLLKAGNYSEESILSAPHERSWCCQRYCRAAVTPHTLLDHMYINGTFLINFNTVIFSPLNAELNPICYLLVLLGAHHFLHFSRIRVKLLTLRLLMSYIYMERLFLMFLDHTQRRTTVSGTPLDE